MLTERKQVGFEFKTVLYAIREAESRKIEGVSSVFHVKNWPGRVFVEAKATKHAFNLLQQLHYVYWNNTFLVPVKEQIGLLRALRTGVELKPGHFVRIRAGLYRRDVAQVLTIDENNGFLRVRVVPQLPPPSVDKKKPKKRART